MARPQEFAADPQATSAIGCWRDWRQAEITAHDGLVRADHPLVLAILGRTQSASSLRRLLRNPLSFVWVYAFGGANRRAAPNPRARCAGIGDLVHMVLDRALRDLEAAGGLASAATEAIEAAVGRARKPSPPTGRANVRFRRPSSGGAPSMMPACWQAAPSSYGDDALPGARAYGEVPFGGSEPKPTLTYPGM
jgi:hypothetical protein